MNEIQSLLCESPSEFHVFYAYYTITLKPGVVRYLTVVDFLAHDVERWLDVLRTLSPEPIIKSPWREYPDSGSRPFGEEGTDLSQVDALVEKGTWADKLRAHHRLGRLYDEKGLPVRVYRCFHTELRLEALEFEECVNAWVRESRDSNDVIESFATSPDHVTLPMGARRAGSERAVFKKTAFVTDRLNKLADERESMKDVENSERLRKSNFRAFVYVMEDLRNGHFKIGRSATPEKRERTLQSEMPKLVMRVAIPAEDSHEKELHRRFSQKRIRGEWFALGPDDLVHIVAFLKRNGDAERASIDYQWFGTVCFNSTSIPDAK